MAALGKGLNPLSMLQETSPLGATQTSMAWIGVVETSTMWWAFLAAELLRKFFSWLQRVMVICLR